MNLVDSSAWLEYFADGPHASFFAKPIERPKELLVPTIVLYEVFKKIAAERGMGDALQAVTVLESGRVVELDARLAVLAARTSLEHRLPMADSVILATARDFGAVLWTQDADFEGIDGVQFRKRRG